MTRTTPADRRRSSHPKTASQRPRRRPLTREEALERQRRRDHQREMEQQSRELAKGPVDLPFLLLVLLLTAIGLVMLLSASFPSAYYETNDPAHYFVRQGVFAIMGVAAMLFIGKINYQRFRALAKPALFVTVVLLALADPLAQVLSFAEELGRRSGLSSELLAPLYKTVAIALVVRVGGSLCRDAGESALAAVVETAGTVCALLAALPLIQTAASLLWELME